MPEFLFRSMMGQPMATPAQLPFSQFGLTPMQLPAPSATTQIEEIGGSGGEEQNPRGFNPWWPLRDGEALLWGPNPPWEKQYENKSLLGAGRGPEEIFGRPPVNTVGRPPSSLFSPRELAALYGRRTKMSLF